MVPSLVVVVGNLWSLRKAARRTAMLLGVFLVIVLGWGVGASECDFGYNRAAELGLLCGKGRAGFGFLLGAGKIYRRAVIVADVGPLTIERGRVVNRPECLEELGKGDACGIVFDANHLGVACGVRTNLAIGRIFSVTTGIANIGRNNAGDFTECGFDAPETSRSEIDGFAFRKGRRFFKGK